MPAALLPRSPTEPFCLLQPSIALLQLPHTHTPLHPPLVHICTKDTAITMIAIHISIRIPPARFESVFIRIIVSDKTWFTIVKSHYKFHFPYIFLVL